MSRHPGRLAALKHAASISDDVGSRERANLIRLGAPGHAPEHVYQQLRHYTELLETYHYPDAIALLESLTEPPADTPETPRK